MSMIDGPTTEYEYDGAPLKLPRIGAEERKQAETMGDAQARYLVDQYYTYQDYRKAAANQITATEYEDQARPMLLEWLTDDMGQREQRIKAYLGYYAATKPVGQWSMSIYGIGPVIAAGLLAHIDIRRAPTVGHVWRFAGQDPTQRWYGAKGAEAIVKAVVAETGYTGEELLQEVARRVNISAETLRRWNVEKTGEARPLTVKHVTDSAARRPWNSRLKTLCWHIGQSFNKFQYRDECFYGRLLGERKQYEIARNEAGENAEAAARQLAEKQYRGGTLTRERLEAGRLSDGQIQARAERWTRKLFLAHWHHVAYESAFGEAPPKPYILTQEGGHAHYIAPPNWG